MRAGVPGGEEEERGSPKVAVGSDRTSSAGRKPAAVGERGVGGAAACLAEGDGPSLRSREGKEEGG